MQRTRILRASTCMSCATRAVNICRRHTLLFMKNARALTTHSADGCARAASNLAVPCPRCSFGGEDIGGRLEKFQSARLNGPNFSRDLSLPPCLSSCQTLSLFAYLSPPHLARARGEINYVRAWTLITHCSRLKSRERRANDENRATNWGCRCARPVATYIFK